MSKKRINKPQHVRRILSEQINELRNNEEATKEDIDRAKAIGYLSNIALTAIKDGELEERIRNIEKQLEGD